MALDLSQFFGIIKVRKYKKMHRFNDFLIIKGEAKSPEKSFDLLLNSVKNIYLIWR